MLPKPRLTLLAAAVLAANLAHATPTASAPFTPEQQQLIRQISASEANGLLPQVASAAAANVAKTIEGEKQAIAVAKDALEVGRKSVDWWLSNISFWVGGLGLLIAVAGIGIPLWMGRTQKAEWQKKLADITQKLAEAQAAQQLAAAAQQQAEQHAREIETLRNNAQNKISLIPNAEQVTGALSAEVLAKLREEKSPQIVTLIEQALKANEKEDWASAKPLWELLSLIESHDANVWFNLAFAEQLSGKNWQLICEAYQFSHLLQPSSDSCNNWGVALSYWAETSTGDAQQQRYTEASQCFAEATRLEQDFADAYNNWGNALFSWAKTLPGEAQLQRFNEADQHYVKAIHIQPNDVDPYYNRGYALSYWAHTLQGGEREAKFAKAEEMLLLAKDKGERNTYNLACLRTMQQRTDEAKTLLSETRTAGFLPDHAKLSSDRALDNLRELDWFKALLAEVKQEEERQAAAV